MKQIFNVFDIIDLALAKLPFLLRLLLKIPVAICKVFFIIVLLIICFVYDVIHYKSYRKEYNKLAGKEYEEKLMDDYEKGLVCMSIDYPKN